MKIVFLAPGITVSGGMRVIFEFANRLQDRGHSVTIVCPSTFEWETPCYKKEMLRRFGRYILADKTVDWFDLRARLIFVPWLAERYIPDADITIATHWKTAEALGQWLSRRKGINVYFVQGYEVFAGPKERVDKTYRLPIPKLVVSSWLKHLMENRFGPKVYGPCVPGIDFEMFYNDSKSYNNPPCIGLIYRPIIWRGTQDGLQAFELARAKYPNIRLLMFGQTWPANELPDDVEFHFCPSQSDIRKIYSRCDVFINPSWLEGLALPPMEAMACRCAVITTAVGGFEDYLIPDETALLVPPRRPDLLANALLKLLDDQVFIRKLSEKGFDYIRQFTWDIAADKFITMLKEILDNDP